MAIDIKNISGQHTVAPTETEAAPRDSAANAASTSTTNNPLSGVSTFAPIPKAAPKDLSRFMNSAIKLLRPNSSTSKSTESIEVSAHDLVTQGGLAALRADLAEVGRGLKAGAEQIATTAHQVAELNIKDLAEDALLSASKNIVSDIFDKIFNK